jgi:hypothetical protein
MRLFMQLDSDGSTEDNALTPENPAYFIVTNLDDDSTNYQFWLIPDNGINQSGGSVILALTAVKDAVISYLEGAGYSINFMTTVNGIATS